MIGEVVKKSGGTTPTGTIQITENGTVDVTDYASANVNVRSWLYYATSIYSLLSPKVGNADIELNLPEVIDLGELHNCRTATSFFHNYTGTLNLNPKEFRFTFNPENTIVVTNMFYRARHIEKVVFVGGIKIADNSYDLFRETVTLKTVEGELDFSSYEGAAYNLIRTTPVLEDLRFKSNTLHTNFNISGSPKLSSDSIQSIIDGLETVTTTKTITFSASLDNPLSSQQEADIQAKGWTLAYA